MGGSNGFVYFGLGGTAYLTIRRYNEGHRTIQLCKNVASSNFKVYRGQCMYIFSTCRMGGITV